MRLAALREPGHQQADEKTSRDIHDERADGEADGEALHDEIADRVARDAAHGRSRQYIKVVHMR